MKIRIIAIALFLAGTGLTYMVLLTNRTETSALPSTGQRFYEPELSDTALVAPADNTTAGTIVDDERSPVAAAEGERDTEAATDRPLTVTHSVPFTAQAPFAEWDDPRQQDACEEAATLMAARWVSGEGLTAMTARREILALVAWEERTFGYATDTNAADTARLLTEYFNVSDVTVVRTVSVDSIEAALADGHIVIVPTDGRLLGNSYFSGAGPERHMLVIIGYDATQRQFITNDPGTKRGAGYRYDYDTMLRAIREYPSGVHEPIESLQRVMIVVGRAA